MATATASTPALPPDPLQLKRRLMLQGGGFALLLLLAFSGTLYWGIAAQRSEDQRSELRQLAATAAAQWPLIAHETREAEGRAKFRAGPQRITVPALLLQRVQWFDASGRLLSEQGSLAVPPMPPLRADRSATTRWQRWPGGLSLIAVVQLQPIQTQPIQTEPLQGKADPRHADPDRTDTRPTPQGSARDNTALQQAVTHSSSVRRRSVKRSSVSLGPGRGVATPREAATGEQRLGYVRVALSDHAAQADLERLRRGLLLGGIVTALAALLVGRRMLQAAFLPLQEQVSALQRFTADASHELRHPLTALRTLLAAAPPELRQHPDLAWRELNGLSKRMGDLLEDLLTLAHLQQGSQGRSRDWQCFDLLELLEDLLRCYAPQARSRAIQLELSPAPEKHRVPVEGDSEELLRLFTNLLLNAIRHSPADGTVTLQVSRAGRLVQVAVCDQGPGIPATERERAFDRFWSGADRGGHSGLGLAIGRAIARRHGGDLCLGESRPGRCVLLVTLPAAADGPQSS